MNRAAALVSCAVPIVLACCSGFNEYPKPCLQSTDCPTKVCAFSTRDGCSGKGHCEDASFNVDRGSMCTSEVACGCDGTPAFPVVGTFRMCVGYDRPIRREGPC